MGQVFTTMELNFFGRKNFLNSIRRQGKTFRVCEDILIEIFYFQTRRKLAQLEYSCLYIHWLIERNLAERPFLLFDVDFDLDCILNRVLHRFILRNPYDSGSREICIEWADLVANGIPRYLRFKKLYLHDKRHRTTTKEVCWQFLLNRSLFRSTFYNSTISYESEIDPFGGVHAYTSQTEFINSFANNVLPFTKQVGKYKLELNLSGNEHYKKSHNIAKLVSALLEVSAMKCCSSIELVFRIEENNCIGLPVESILDWLNSSDRSKHPPNLNICFTLDYLNDGFSMDFFKEIEVKLKKDFLMEIPLPQRFSIELCVKAYFTHLTSDQIDTNPNRNRNREVILNACKNEQLIFERSIDEDKLAVVITKGPIQNARKNAEREQIVKNTEKEKGLLNETLVKLLGLKNQLLKITFFDF